MKLIVQMNEKEKRLVTICIENEKGVSNWLTMLPITEHGFELSKQQFWDSVGLQYGWKSQIFKHFVHAEVNSTFSTALAVRKVVL